MGEKLGVGKVAPSLLEELIFTRLGAQRHEVLVKPRVGEDVAVVDLGGELLVASVDPITGAADRMGWLAAKVALNDIGAAGAEPVCLLVTLFLPEGTAPDDLRRIMDDMDAACREEGAAIVGGHTEVTPGIVRPIVSVTAIGKSRSGKVLSASGARPGDDIVVTKWAGMEGTSILVRDFPWAFAEVLSEAEKEAARSLFEQVSVCRDGRIALEHGASGSHDATEGGVLGAIYEVCCASRTGAIVRADDIPVLEVTRKVAARCGIDALRLVSSGCLVVTTPDGQGLCRAYKEAGINAAVVGTITSGEKEVIRSGSREPLLPPESDELWKARSVLESEPWRTF